jgi:hypothetical protein
MPIPVVEDMIIENIDQYLESKFDITIANRYKPIINPTPNPLSLTQDQVNNKLQKMGLTLQCQYSGRMEDRHKVKCLSPIGHEYEVALDYVQQSGKCSYCSNEHILLRIPIYEYTDRTYDYVRSYNSFEELKSANPTLNHQLLKNIIREERWLTAHEGKIYSILEPFNGKLDLFKPLSEVEKFIINILDIHYESMRTKITNSKLVYVIAVQVKSKNAYFGISATEFGRKLKQANSEKVLNRKTISKYLNTGKDYGGYIWITSSAPIHKNYTMTDIATL